MSRRLALSAALCLTIATSSVGLDAEDECSCRLVNSSIDDQSPSDVPMFADVDLTASDVPKACRSCEGSTWTADVSWVYMWREDPASRPLVATIGGETVFDASQFSFEGRSGVDISFGYDNGCGRGLEFRYMWIDEFEDAPGVFPANAPAFTRILTNPPTPSSPVFYVAPFTPVYKSEIQSLELLGHRCVGNARLTCGFRHIYLDESLLLQIGTPVNVAAFNAPNNLYGFQLGLEGPIWDRGYDFSVDGSAKAGLYGSDTDASSSVTTPQSPFFNGQGSASDGDAAFVGELQLRATYDVTCKLSVHAGYQLLLLDGVTLGADQVPNTGDLFANPNTTIIVDESSLLYQGLHVGLEYHH